MTAINAAGSAAISSTQSGPFNFETEMLAVQMESVTNVDLRLEGLIDGIKANNARTTKLNEALKLVNSLIDKFGTTTDPTKTKEMSAEDTKAIEAALADLGIKPEDLFGANFTKNDAKNQENAQALSKMGKTARNIMAEGPLAPKPTGYSSLTLSDFKTAVATFKGDIDTLSSTQQLEMLSLQSYISKRTELIDMASTLTKKFHDTISSIVRNIS